MDYEVIGGSFPMVIFTLQEGETLKNETGTMAFMTDGVKMSTNTGGGLIKGLGRALSGDSLFLTFFTADKDNQRIGFSSGTPGKVFPVKLNGTNSVIGQKNAFLVAEEGVDVGIHFRKKLGTGIFGGEGFVLQKFSGTGMVFLEIDGDVIEYDLQPGEKLLLDPGSLAAMEETVEFDVERVKGAKNILFGEGLFFSRLTGPGKVWIQTMPLSKFAEALIPYIPSSSD